MDTFAWMGVGFAAVLLLAAAVVWRFNMVTNPIGRAIVVGWSLIAAALWAIGSGLYLLWAHGG